MYMYINKYMNICMNEYLAIESGGGYLCMTSLCILIAVLYLLLQLRHYKSTIATDNKTHPTAAHNQTTPDFAGLLFFTSRVPASLSRTQLHGALYLITSGCSK